jgi:hypothetical protein
MTKPAIYFNDFVSLAVMLLMVVALVTGQSGAGAYAADKGQSIAPLATIDDRFNISLDGHIGDQALKISIAVVTDLSHFRGEDE